MQCRMQCQFDGKHRMYHGINRRSSQITQSSDQNVVACGLGLVFMLAVEWNVVFMRRRANKVKGLLIINTGAKVCN